MNGITHGFGMGFFGWTVPLLLLLLIIYLLKDRKESRQNGKSAAQEILDRRYASGGISKEEYEEKSRDLQEHA